MITSLERDIFPHLGTMPMDVIDKPLVTLKDVLHVEASTVGVATGPESALSLHDHLASPPYSPY